MKLTHEQYLNRVLASKRMELNELKIKHRVEIAEYNVKLDMLNNQIYSIENQLDNGKSDKNE